MKSFINQNRRTATLTALAACVGLAVFQAQAQSVTYTFSDGTSDGWADAGFSDTPASSVSTINGQNYIYVPYTGFQAGSDASDSPGNLPGFNSAMYAALNDPSAYDISYTYYIDTSTFQNATFLQLGIFVNTGSGYYDQDYSTPNQVSFSGSQLSSGQVFTGTVTENLGTMGVNDASAATETYFRLGLVENTGSGTSGVGVYYTDISVSPAPVPEPATLSLCGLGAASGLMFLRRRRKA